MALALEEFTKYEDFNRNMKMLEVLRSQLNEMSLSRKVLGEEMMRCGRE